METDELKDLLGMTGNPNPDNGGGNPGAGSNDGDNGDDGKSGNGGDNGDTGSSGSASNQQQQSQNQNQQTDEVEILLNINDKGDVVDTDGNIIIEHSKVEKDQDGSIVIPDDILQKYSKTKEPETGIALSVKEFEKELGIKFVDEENKPITFEDSPKGYAELNKFVVNKMLDKEVENELSSIFQQYPDVEEYLIHRANGGSYETFKIAPQTSSIKKAFDDKDEDFLFNVVVEAAIKRGNSSDDAKMLAESYEKSGKLLTKAKSDYDFLIAKDKEEKAVKQKAIEDAREANRKAFESYVSDVKTIVSKKELKGLKISDNEINGFVEYVTKPNNDGLVQAVVEAQQADLETRLAIEYLRYKKFNFKTLVETLVQQEAVNKIKFRAKGNINNAGGSGQRTVIRQGSVDDISIDRMFN